MKPSAMAFPGHKINDYLLLLSPAESIYNKVLQVKQECFEKYHTENALWGIPHITIVKFRQYAMNEGRIVNVLKTVGVSTNAFRIEWHNSGSFPSHTIYLHEADKTPFRQLLKTIRLQRELLTMNATNPPHFSEQPHVTITRKMHPLQFEKAWQQFSQMKFSAECIVDSMLLVRRQAGIQMKYQLVEKIDFLGLPAAAIQADQNGNRNNDEI